VVTRGEVWWYEHPDAGRRPYLVMTRPEAIPVLNQVLAVPATRTIRGIATEVEVGPAEGMPGACALAVDNLSLIRVAGCTTRIAVLNADVLARVCAALHFATAC
jgi:mRNA-degrading endonuclease toxin of MazEF toxin-antitoxin module